MNLAKITIDKREEGDKEKYRVLIEGVNFWQRGFYDTLDHALEATCHAVMIARDQEEGCDCKPNLIDMLESMSKKESGEPIQVKVKKINI